MADEPKSKIDEALKAYARKRREGAGAPVEMHPATRRLLQGEVTRLRGGRGVQGAFSEWLAFLPRFGFALSIAIVLAVVIWSLQPPAPQFQAAAELESLQRNAVFYDREDAPAFAEEATVEQDKAGAGRSMDLAKNKADAKGTWYRELKDNDAKQLDESRSATPPNPSGPAPAATPMNRPALPPATTSEALRVALADERAGKKEVSAALAAAAVRTNALGTLALAQNEGVQNSEFSKALNAGVMSNAARFNFRDIPSTPAAPRPIPGASPAADYLGEQPVAIITAASDAAPNAAEKPAPQQTLFFSTDFADGQPRAGGAASIATEAGDRFQRSGPPAVLQNFEFQQNGNQVRVVDGDGSVYSGFVITRSNGDAAAESPTEPQSRLGEVRRTEPARGVRQEPASREKLSFKAAGTNRTLNQLVVLDGTVAPELAPAVSTRPESAAARRSRALAPNVPAPTNQILRLRGQLRIGVTNELAIDALRVTR